MKTKIAIITFTGFVLMYAVGLKADGDWDIYSDALIKEGDDYWTVRIFDSPPDHTTVDMTGGWANVIQTYDASTFNMSGGITEVSAHDVSIINMGGGKIYTLQAAESSTANVFGGSVNSLVAWNNGTVNVWGGVNVLSLVSDESGVVNMSGGEIDHISALGFGVVNLSGGLVTDSLGIIENGIVYIYGYEMSKFSIGGKYGYGFVSGYWENGNLFSIDLNGSETYSRVVLIPEPSSMLLFLMGSLLFKIRKR